MNNNKVRRRRLIEILQFVKGHLPHVWSAKKFTLMNKSDPVLHYRKSQHEVDETYDFSFLD